MPFDVIPMDQVEVPVTKPFDFDTATFNQRLVELARHLEDEQAWRDIRMRWNYGECYSNEDTSACGTAGCALGLAVVLWGTKFKPQGWDDGFAAFDEAQLAFGLNKQQAYYLFGYSFTRLMRQRVYQVQPGEVACRIRRFVKQRVAIGHGGAI